MTFSRMIWLTDSGPSVDSWNYWSSKAETIFSASTGDSISKYNNKIAYFAVAYVAYPRWIAPMHIMISPDADAVSWQTSGDARVFTYHDTITDENGIEWYISGGESVWVNDYVTFTPNCIINTKQNPYDGSPSNTHLLKDIAQDLLDRIYSTPFHEKYQVGQHYTLPVCDVEKAVRKALGVFLFWNIADYGIVHDYTVLSDNSTDVISRVTSSAYGSRVVHLVIGENLPPYNHIMWCYNIDGRSLTGECSGSYTTNGYKSMGFTGATLPSAISRYNVDCSGSTPWYTATIVENQTLYPYAQNCFSIGVDLDSGMVVLSNLGIDL